MITRRRFIGLLAAILPAAWLGIDPMETKAAVPQPKSHCDSAPWDLDQYWIDPRHERYCHMLDSYKYMVGSQWSQAQRAQRELNHRRSLVLNRMVGPKVKFDAKRYGVIEIKS
jgi:hypothetical protein